MLSACPVHANVTAPGSIRGNSLSARNCRSDSSFKTLESNCVTTGWDEPSAFEGVECGIFMQRQITLTEPIRQLANQQRQFAHPYR